jgi:hypothetical protein
MAEWKYVTRLGIQDRLDRIMQILKENDVVQKVLEQNRQRIEGLKRLNKALNKHHAPGPEGSVPPPRPIKGLEGKGEVE